MERSDVEWKFSRSKVYKNDCIANRCSRRRILMLVISLHFPSQHPFLAMDLLLRGRVHGATTVQHDSKSQGPAQGSALQVGQPVVVVVVNLSSNL